MLHTMNIKCTQIYQRFSIKIKIFINRKYQPFTKQCREPNTVKPEYNNHPRDPKFVAVLDRWSLFRGNFMFQKIENGTPNGGRYRQVVVNSGLTVPQ
jgi:hypothetical protein